MKIDSINLTAFQSAGWSHKDFEGYFGCNIQWFDPATNERQILDILVTKENLPAIQAAQRALVMREAKKHNPSRDLAQDEWGNSFDIDPIDDPAE